MFRKAFAFGGTLLVAAALVFLTPGSGQAAPRGGGHGGGFHGGGYHFGGYHGGYHYGGYYSRPYYGGYHYGGYHYRPYYGGYYPYYGNYPYYSYHPYYDSSDPYYSSYSDYGSGSGSGSVYNPGYSSFYYQPTPSSSDGITLGSTTTSNYQPSSASSFPAQADTSAHLTVTVPADAEIWFEGTKVTTSGSVREFQSPPLTPGKQYTYDVRTRWHEGNREVTQTQEVEVTAGTHARVEFPVPPGTSASSAIRSR